MEICVRVCVCKTYEYAHECIHIILQMNMYMYECVFLYDLVLVCIVYIFFFLCVCAPDGPLTVQGVSRTSSSASSSNGSSSTSMAKGLETPRHSLSCLSRMGAMYARSLETHPILTKTLTSSSIAALGNIIAQLVFERRAQGPAFRFQVLNVLRMAGFSAIIAPCIHKWYQFLDKVFGNTSKAMVCVSVGVHAGVPVLSDVTECMSVCFLRQAQLL